MPGEVIACNFSQPMQQSYIEAGAAPIGISATGVAAFGIVQLATTAAASGSSQVTQDKTMSVEFARATGDTPAEITANRT